MKRSERIRREIIDLKENILEIPKAKRNSERKSEEELNLYEFNIESDYKKRRRLLERLNVMERTRILNRIDDLEVDLTKIENEECKKESEHIEKELIWWKGTELQLTYFFDLLYNNDLIDVTSFEKRFALMRDHFKNKGGKGFNNRQASVAAKKIDRMKDEDKNTMKAMVKSIKQK